MAGRKRPDKEKPELSPIFVVEQIETRPVDELISYANNPKDHPEAQIETLAHLIKNFGFLVPIVVDEKGLIGAGEGRLRAAKKLGMEKVPTVKVEHLTEAQLKAFRIADNAAARTGWWEEALKLEIAGLQEIAFDLSLTGMNAEELTRWVQPLEVPPGPRGRGGGNGDPGEETDWLQELVEKWKVEPGQIWEIPSKTTKGVHRLVCGDSTKSAVFAALMAGRKAAMVFTDPPYGIDYCTENHDKIANDELQRDELLAFLHSAFRNLVEHAEDDAAFYIWHASGTRDEYSHAMKAAGLQERQYLIWAKENMTLSWSDYQWSHESCFYASKAGHPPKWTGDRGQQTLWRIEAAQGDRVFAVLGPGLVLADGKGGELYVTSSVPKKKLRTFRLEPGKQLAIQAETGPQTVWEAARDPKPRHATQKPAQLAARAIKNSSLLGDIVLDAFLGSGSTMVAAEAEARISYGVELSPRNVAGALEWMAEMGLTPSLIDYVPADD